MKFSERQGLVTVRKTVQTDSMSLELRASLWNVLHLYWDRKGFRQHVDNYAWRGEIVDFGNKLWLNYFKRPFSEIPHEPTEIVSGLQSHFFSLPWHGACDFIEAVLEIEKISGLLKALNGVLERELAGFRIVDWRFVRVTATEEVAALDEALSETVSLALPLTYVAR